MKWLLNTVLLFGAICCCRPSPVEAQVKSGLPPNIVTFVVKTRSPENMAVPFFVRIPKSYLQNPEKRLYRVLLAFPFINEDGYKVVTGDGGLLATADEQGWFVISPTFHQNKNGVQDRKLSYYYPEAFSGRAIVDGLNLIRSKYPIATYGLLVHGFSGGGQIGHRFAIWAPDRVTAVVVDSSSWFDPPTAACSRVAWLVTIGEADPSFENTLGFIASLKAAGALPVMRSYFGMTHQRGKHVLQLDIEFLKFYDALTRNQMSNEAPMDEQSPHPPITASAMPFVGDTQAWRYYKNTPDRIEDIPEETRIFLPSAIVAKAWGDADEDATDDTASAPGQ